MKSTKGKEVKVYMFVLDTTASAYYRIIQPFKYFQDKNNGFKFHLVATFNPQYFAEGDIFIFQRLADRSLFDLLMFLRNQGKKIIFDMDYYPEPPPYHPQFNFYSSLRPFLQLVLSNANYVLTPTSNLAEELKSYNEKIAAIPNFIHPHYWKSKGKKEKKKEMGLPQNAVVLGWTGNPMNQQNLNQIKSVFEELSCKYENLYFAFFGQDPQFIALPPERKIIREFKAYPSYPEYLDFIDIGVAPLEDTLFNRCKSPSLVLEYGMKKIPVVASEVGTYKTLKEEGAPILVAKEKEDWLKALPELIENEDLREERGKELHNFVKQNYLIKLAEKEFIKVLKEVLGES